VKRAVDWRAPALGQAHRLETRLGPLHYREAGDGPPVVFVHGFLSNANLWHKLIEHVAPHARCLSVDWPLGSHYEAMRADADLRPPAIRDLIVEFLAALDLREVILVGNDSGGAYTQMVAADGGDGRLAGLFLSGCETPEDHWPPKGFGHLQRAGRTRGGLTLMMQSLRLPPGWRSAIAYGLLAKRPIEREVMWSYLDPFFRDRAVRRDACKVISEVGPAYHQRAAKALQDGFSKPVLFAWAREDPVFPFAHAQTYAGTLRNARLETIEDSYTYTAQDRPTRVAQLLNAFVRRVHA
jgi:pimeloyl-ACP methyl ester carboxylesterase